MFHLTASAAKAEATPVALASLLRQGVTALVLVENAKGEFFFLHADDLAHGERLARNWVDVMSARACSVWSIKGAKLARSPHKIVAPDWEEAA